MAYGDKQKQHVDRTSDKFEASWNSNCSLGEDTIEAGETIVMCDGEAVHWQCAENAGWKVPE